MSVAGIDFSSRAIDVVILDDDTDHATWHRRRLDLKPGDAFERARRVRDAMPARAAWPDSGVVMVAIEDPWSRQASSLKPLLRVQGAILACLPPELAVVPLEPWRWREACGLKANASKQTVREWARGRMDDRCELWVQDAFDAYAIAWAARQLCEHAQAA